MKLAKVSEGESENENLIMALLLATDEGVLPDPASILKSNWSRNLSLLSHLSRYYVTFINNLTFCFQVFR